jgi:6-phosphogluconolactonase (cycloisomerase 2 family)
MKNVFYILLTVVAISSCNKTGKFNPNNNNGDVVYFETNDAAGNGIMAYWHKNDSTLELIPGSPFATGGLGVANPTQGLGPDDDDNQVRITSDYKFLLAVNPGSNSISVFNIGSEGQLAAVAGSPFPSGGINPVSIGESGKYLYVVNKAIAPGADVDPNPNYTPFTISEEGKLSPVPNSAFETTAGSSPSQALGSHDGRFVFGADFLGFMDTPAVGTLRSFVINKQGGINPVAGTPYVIPEKGGALGLWQNPRANVLYVGFPLAGQIGVYDIDPSSGALNFNNSVSSGAAVCWLRTNSEGSNLYALNSAENSVSVFNTSTASSPVSVQKLALADPGPDYTAMGMSFPTSEDFSLSFSPSGKTLYVISQYTNPDFTLGNFNLLHVLKVAEDGTLSELTQPVPIPVSSTVRPQGLVSYQIH